MRLFTLRGTIYVLLAIALIALAGCSKTQTVLETEISIEESPFSDMTNKKVILRNDDVGGPTNIALMWLSDLVVEKDIKMTYAVIPKLLQENPGTISYLRSLDRSRFEMGTHGYAHEYFENLPYDEQYRLIELATDLMKQFFYTAPWTYLPPGQSANVETTRVLKELGYHTLASLRYYSAPYVETDFARNDFGWELSWSPLTFATYEDFVQAFDNFYELGQSRSQNDFFVIASHSPEFVDGSGQLKSAIVNDYEKSIEYMTSKNVEFMTVEEGYQWVIDMPNIVVTQGDENSYFINLDKCIYDHTVRFSSPPGWGSRVLVRDISTGEETHMPGDYLEFQGTMGHKYMIANTSGGDESKANQPPVLVEIGNKSVNRGELLTLTISATDPDGDRLRYTYSNLPPGASFNTKTQDFSWAPVEGGTYSDVHFEVSDGELSDSEDINISVNLPPALTDIGDKEAAIGQVIQFTVSGSDLDGDPLTYSAFNLPAEASFDSGIQTFSWTPTSEGNYSDIRFEVSDGKLADSDNITIRVYHAGYLPPAVSFIDPTAASGATLNTDWAEVNVSLSGSDDMSSFIDWNSSLVGYWSLDEGSGVTANDKSTYSNNGTLYGGPTWTTGKFGNALVFDGSDDYLEVPHNDLFNFGTGNFTVE